MSGRTKEEAYYNLLRVNYVFNRHLKNLPGETALLERLMRILINLIHLCAELDLGYKLDSSRYKTG